MKLLSVMRAESVRALRTIGGDFGYVPKAAAALIQQYGFIGAPTAEELATPDNAKGITFRRGKLETEEKIIGIDFLQIYAAGVSVTTHSHTSDSDVVLDHIVNWAQAEFKLEFEPIKPGIGHSSQLEFRLEKPLPALFPLLAEIGAAITKGLDDWWGFKPSYELINLNFWFDRTRFPTFSPPIFRIDRREGVPHEQEVYYSEAGMSTDNHKTVLERFERICLKALEK